MSREAFDAGRLTLLVEPVDSGRDELVGSDLGPAGVSL